MSGPDLDDEDEHRAGILRERLYITFTSIAVIIVILRHEHVSPAQAALTLLVAVLGTVTAGFLSEVISYNLVRHRPAVAQEWRHLFQIAWGGLVVIVLPLILILCAQLGWIPLEGALRGSLLVLVTSLAAFGLLAFRPMHVPTWRKAVGLASLVAGAFLVIGLELLAHGARE